MVHKLQKICGEPEGLLAFGHVDIYREVIGNFTDDFDMSSRWSRKAENLAGHPRNPSCFGDGDTLHTDVIPKTETSLTSEWFEPAPEFSHGVSKALRLRPPN